MNSKKLILTAFILMALAQWYVPANMILDREAVLSSGKEFKFRTAPIDPSDPFRGKYITLSFRENHFPVPDDANWIRGEDVYVLLSTDKEGYARIQSVSKEKPHKNVDFVTAKVGYVTTNGDKNLLVEYPFDRFYMEESKAYDAEQVYLRSLSDTTKVTYALVNTWNGKAVLKDVRIDGTSIKELVKARQE
jgi:uncharacterized membrane-anchored protein